MQDAPGKVTVTCRELKEETHINQLFVAEMGEGGCDLAMQSVRLCFVFRIVCLDQVYYVHVCDATKQNESDLGNINLKI